MVTVQSPAMLQCCLPPGYNGHGYGDPWFIDRLLPIFTQFLKFNCSLQASKQNLKIVLKSCLKLRDQSFQTLSECCIFAVDRAYFIECYLESFDVYKCS